MFEEEVTAEGTIYKMTVRDIIMKDFGEVSYFSCYADFILCPLHGPLSVLGKNDTVPTLQFTLHNKIACLKSVTQ
jgi:hypothetical protein